MDPKPVNRTLLALLLGLCALLAGCGTNRPANFLNNPSHDTYFRQHYTRHYTVLKLKNDPDSAKKSYQYTIKSGDEIEVRYFNLPPEFSGMLNVRENSSGTVISSQNYLVDVSGNIRLLVLGEMHVEGMTIAQLRERLLMDYAKYFVNPILDCRIANFRVYAFGEFGVTGVIKLNQEKTHLVEVLAQLNGVKQTGKLHKIKIVRGSVEDPQVIWVNLRNIDALKSDELVVNDRDILYAEPRGLYFFVREIQPYSAVINTILVIPSLVLLIQNLSAR